MVQFKVAADIIEVASTHLACLQLCCSTFGHTATHPTFAVGCFSDCLSRLFVAVSACPAWLQVFDSLFELPDRYQPIATLGKGAYGTVW